MARDEAIKVLNTYDVNFDGYRAEDIADAIDMAVEALSADAVMRDATAEERAGIQRYIDSISTEAVQVVRCKECDRGFGSPVCPIQSQGWAIDIDTFYCAWGERKMSKIYIAGPITDVDGYEKSFNDAEKELTDMGFEVCNPISPGLVDGAGYKYYIDRGLRMLMECDAIYMLPGWRKSKGATLESFYAMICGLEYYEQEDDDDE